MSGMGDGDGWLPVHRWRRIGSLSLRLLQPDVAAVAFSMIYFDNNATTRLDPAVLDAMQSAAACPGNPGSRHQAGRRARQILESAREEVASLLGAQPDEVYFTSGGTEANNLALRGLAAGRPGMLLAPAGEHPSLIETLRALTSPSRKVIEVPLDEDGACRWDQISESSWNDAVLASCVWAHNETGVIRDLSQLAARCTTARLPWHVDAVQAVGKIPVNFAEIGATTLSFAAHKFHGPCGVGGLLIRRGARLVAVSTGGFQEGGLRPGTEPVALVAGLACALRRWRAEYEESTKSIQSLRDQLQSLLLERCAPAVVNGGGAPRLPNTLHISFPGCPGEALLIALDLAGVCASLGSACASGSTEPSPVLLAMGLAPERIESGLRLSLSKDNTLAEVQQAVEIIESVTRRLRSA